MHNTPSRHNHNPMLSLDTPKPDRAFLPRLAVMLVFNTLVALGVTTAGANSFGTNWVFTQCIGLSIWSFLSPMIRAWGITSGNAWARMVLIVPLGTLWGYVLGSILASLLLQLPLDTGWSNLTDGLRYLLLSLLIGTGATYVFVSRAELRKAKERDAAAQLSLAQAQLQLLQAQLEPHMLFNTLANLRVLITVDPARATAMLDRLVDFLRATLSASRQTLHPLSAEFARLQDYLALMAVRMGPRLKATFDLPADVAAQPVPSLLLQPLVENSIRHGLEPNVAGGSIYVSARREGNMLVLEVTDSGVGLPTPTPPAGFGLTQVREQLAAAYGAQATMECIAVSAGGTSVKVQFPLKV